MGPSVNARSELKVRVEMGAIRLHRVAEILRDVATKSSGEPANLLNLLAEDCENQASLLEAVEPVIRQSWWRCTRFQALCSAFMNRSLVAVTAGAADFGVHG